MIAGATFLLLLNAGILAAQSNNIMDEILASAAISYEQAAYLLLIADGTLEDEAPLTVAHRQAEARGTALGAPPEKSLTLGEFAWLTMDSFGIDGGLMYRIAPGPRYAARELAFREVIQARAYPGMPISGEWAVRIIGRVLTLTEAGRLQ